MSKRVPIYVSKYELQVAIACIKITLNRIKELKSEVEKVEQVKERLEAELATFEE